MKTFVVTLLLTLGLLGCVTQETRYKQAQEDFAWLEMCQLLEDETAYGCTRLMSPLVEYEIMRPGLHGYYDGSDTVYINSELGTVETTEVLMHEGIHYVHVQLLFVSLQDGAEAICWSENEAWTLTGLYYNEDNSKWWHAYPHCWEYYADSTELKEIGYIYNTINEIINGIIFED